MAILPDQVLKQIFLTARSRNGWSDRPVDDATIKAIYDLAKFGPTSANSQPARFIWVRSEEQKAKLAECASANNSAKIMAAPVTVIVGRDLDFAEHLPRTFPHAPQMHEAMKQPALAAATAQRNTTLQGAWLIVAARALGLDCGPMSGFDNAKVDEAFLAGTNVQSDFLCSIGYGTDENMFDRLPRLSFEETNRIV